MSGECDNCAEHTIDCQCVNAIGQYTHGAKNEKFFIKEAVDHPSHYRGDQFEVIDIIEDFDLNFNLGNSLKYILRAGKKGSREEDLKKAIWYLQRELGI